VDYNNSKTFIDITDQTKAYSSALHKANEWYQKLAVALLLGLAAVNSCIIYKNVILDSLSITEFWERVVLQLLAMDDENQTDTELKYIIKIYYLKTKNGALCVYKRIRKNVVEEQQKRKRFREFQVYFQDTPNSKSCNKMMGTLLQ
jgi:hypothetical protein